MARRRRAKIRKILPDPRYNSVDLSKLINSVMMKGKKTVAQRIVYSALDSAEKETSRPALEIFDQAIRNATPVIEVRSRRVGGANYQVPTEVRPARRLTLSMRWLVSGARQRSGKGMAEKLSAEIVEASRGQGAAVRRKEEVYRMAEANRAFAHYRW